MLHRGRPPRQQGRVGKANAQFSQTVLMRWYEEAASQGQDERIDENVYRVPIRAFDMGRKLVTAYIDKITRPNGGATYRGRNVQVGHKVSQGKD